jgi:hypothetical protein
MLSPNRKSAARTPTMVKQAIRHIVLLGGFLAACSPDGSGEVARVTIDMRCGTNLDCPSGFRCESEAEHGPPITLCESSDPDLTCPPGFDTKIGFGQTFCKPRSRAGARASRATTSSTMRPASADLADSRGGSF